ncbi:MAG TPA: hypothetical protein VIV12_09050 [Streptosporangiaceae bacterium]
MAITRFPPHAFRALRFSRCGGACCLALLPISLGRLGYGGFPGGACAFGVGWAAVACGLLAG